MGPFREWRPGMRPSVREENERNRALESSTRRTTGFHGIEGHGDHLPARPDQRAQITGVCSSVQLITALCDGGNFTINFGGASSGPINCGSSAAAVQAAISGVLPAGTTVSGNSGGPWTVTLPGIFPLVTFTSNLTLSTGTPSVTATVPAAQTGWYSWILLMEDGNLPFTSQFVPDYSGTFGPDSQGNFAAFEENGNGTVPIGNVVHIWPGEGGPYVVFSYSALVAAPCPTPTFTADTIKYDPVAGTLNITQSTINFANGCPTVTSSVLVSTVPTCCGACCDSMPTTICGFVCESTDPNIKVGIEFKLYQTTISPPPLSTTACGDPCASGSGSGSGSGAGATTCQPAGQTVWIGNILGIPLIISGKTCSISSGYSFSPPTGCFIVSTCCPSAIPSQLWLNLWGNIIQLDHQTFPAFGNNVPVTGWFGTVPNSLFTSAFLARYVTCQLCNGSKILFLYFPCDMGGGGFVLLRNDGTVGPIIDCDLNTYGVTVQGGSGVVEYNCLPFSAIGNNPNVIDNEQTTVCAAAGAIAVFEGQPFGASLYYTLCDNPLGTFQFIIGDQLTFFALSGINSQFNGTYQMSPVSVANTISQSRDPGTWAWFGEANNANSTGGLSIVSGIWNLVVKDLAGTTVVFTAPYSGQLNFPLTLTNGNPPAGWPTSIVVTLGSPPVVSAGNPTFTSTVAITNPCCSPFQAQVTIPTPNGTITVSLEECGSGSGSGSGSGGTPGCGCTNGAPANLCISCNGVTYSCASGGSSPNGNFTLPFVGTDSSGNCWWGNGTLSGGAFGRSHGWQAYLDPSGILHLSFFEDPTSNGIIIWGSSSAITPNCTFPVTVAGGGPNIPLNSCSSGWPASITVNSC